MADQYTWTLDASGNWTTAGNWTTGSNSIPTVSPNAAGITALIAQTGVPYDVSITSTTISIGTILLESNAATLSLSSATLNTNNITLTAGTITLDANAYLSATTVSSLNGALMINGGTVAAGSASLGATGTIDFTAGGSLTFYGMLTTTPGALIEATGGVAIVGSGNDLIGSGGTILANGGTLLLDTQAGGNTVTIGTALGSEIDITGYLYYGNTVTVNFLGAAGEFAYSGSQGYLNFNITALNAAAGMTNFIDLAGALTVTDGQDGSGSSGRVVLSNGDVLNLSGITQQTGTAWRVETVADNTGGTEIYLQAVCYAAGTNLLTPDGERPVETLRPGDLVMIVAGDRQEARTVRWIGWRRLDLNRHPAPDSVAPVRITRGAIAEAVPHRDLVVSPDHGIYVFDRLIAARQLINGATIRQESDWTAVDYYHVELDEHAILLAEGLTAESYLDTGNRCFFANGSEPLMLHPDLSADADRPEREAGSCAPFLWQEDEVRPIWQRLADRAEALGHRVARANVSADPVVRVLVDGQPVRPMQLANGRCVLAVPPNATSIRIHSRASAPADARPWHNDARRRGIRLQRIIRRTGGDVQDVPLDHPSLCAGWLAVERGGAAMRRWTDGNAELRLAPNGSMSVLELRFDTDELEYVLPPDAVSLAA